MQLKDIFKIETAFFTAYKNEGDETGLSLPFGMSNNELRLLCDVEDNVCLEFQVEFNEEFANFGSDLVLKISTDEIYDSSKQSYDSAMLFRSEIIAYRKKPGTDLVVDTRVMEAEAYLCPDCEINEGILYFRAIRKRPVKKLNLDIWGFLSKSPLNAYRKCMLKVELIDYKIKF